MHFRQYRHILSSTNGMNLYRGCSHGCIYCDSRSKCYGMEHDFEDIEVKIDAPAILESELKAKRKKCIIGTGAMSDPYIPEEQELKYTRACLEHIEALGFGLAVQTKSDLILRDLDLLQAIHKQAKCTVQITLTTASEELCRIVEPNVCTTARRVELLQILHDSGIPTVVWLCPILPFINDSLENLKALLNSCLQTGVKAILCWGMGMTLRQGNREYYYTQLDAHFPGLKQKYVQYFGTSYGINSPQHKKLWPMFLSYCAEHGIQTDIRQIFADIRSFPSPPDSQLEIF